MLSLFRRGAMAKVMLGVLFLSLVAIVITGFGTGGTGGLGELGGLGGSTVAKVGGEKITTTRLTDETQRQLARLRQQNPTLDMGSFLGRGALEEIADQLIGITANVVFGEKQGLAASRQMIDREIAGIPAFQNFAGKFDPVAMQRALQQERITEDQLREEIRTRAIERQLVLPATGSPYMPQAFANQYAALLLERRTGMVGAVPSAAMGVGTEPGEAELAAYYRNAVQRYTIPERRVIRYAAFGPEKVAAQSQATEAEIAAAYRQNAAAYAARESRTLSQVVMGDAAAARAFAAKVAAGTPFAQAAAQAGYAAADIAVGDKTKDDYARMSAPAVANAVFGAAKGATVGPLRSDLGWHVVRVDNVKTIPGRTLESARGELGQRIAAQKSQNLLADLANRIDNEINDGASFEDVVKKNGLTVVETPPVTAAGAAPDMPGWTAPQELAPLLEGAFAMDAGDDPSVETIAPNQRFALVALGRIVPAAPPPLARIRDRVKADLIATRATERARAVAQAIVSKINSGVSPAQAFAEAGAGLKPPQTITAVRRDIARQNQGVPPPLAMLFSLPRGKARLLRAGTQGWFVVYLGNIEPGDAAKEPGLVQAVRGQFAEILSDEYGRQFTNSLRAAVKVKRNEEALRKLKAELLGRGQ
ncbi:MAG: SurA N-terminal domain-containing protein [Alphaproteobacteria bacterium]|nr:SurA N-terminal domain-containing protein [Alphaproteobacteria bacterium]MBV9370781.1 SurA N-terminal domain-containing protein [Alphaproteobacteria bacterium]MBV9900139.1 SurA N-terminal domain-containing protein [Alphaproteobacteria bacterium]